MNKSIINSYRLSPTPTQPTPGVIAGRIIPAVTSANYRRALVVLAVVLLPLLAVGVVIYAAQATRPAPAAVPPALSPVVATPVIVVQERVVEVQASPVVIIVTATPMPAPVQVAPVAPRQVAPQIQAQPVAPLPTARPRIQPTSPPAPSPVVGGPVRAAAPVAQQTPDAGPQQKLFNRPCEYQRVQYPQGTVIKGYYTDANGIKQDAICRPDGWKAVD